MPGPLPPASSGLPNVADWTADDLRNFRNGLIKARASGNARILYQSPIGRQEVEFRTDAEMAAAIADLDRRIASLAGVSPVSFFNPRSNRGWS